tara:strand:- start:6806 stop:8131 length:1326 start_codon:yes stop_codon:yes gene_type:complete
MKINEKSIDILEGAFKVSDIYHSNNFNYIASSQDIGTNLNSDKLRAKWIYGNLGLVKTLPMYSSFIERLLDLHRYSDYLNTFRQRLAMIHEMMEFDFNSLVPVHISVMPKNECEKTVLDFNNENTFKDFYWIIHPGQTRAQTSVFFKHNLKNVLLYLNKDFNIDFRPDSSFTRVSPANIFSFYNTHNGNAKSLDFNSPYLENKIFPKIHETHNVPILKVYEINNNIDTLQNQHPSQDYLSKGFLKFNNFCKVFFNNDFHIYTDDKPLFKKNYFLYKEDFFKNNLNIDFSNFSNIIFPSNYDYTGNNFYKDVTATDQFHTIFSNEEKKLVISVNNFLNSIKEKIDSSKYSNSMDNILKDNFIETKMNIEELVKLNKFKGFFYYQKASLIPKKFRLIEEFIFCLNPTFSIVKSEKYGVYLVNCEHQYWKTGKDYKEYYIDNFI